MSNEISSVVRDACEKNGIDWVRARVVSMAGNASALPFQQWLNEYERLEREIAEAEQRRLSEAAIDAAKLSAEISRDAAVAARKSARWTMWAAIAAAVTALIPLLQAYGVLRK